MEKRSGEPHRVDLVDPLATLVAFAPHPVAVEVGTDTVEHFAGEPVIFPLLRVELQNALVHQVLAVLGRRVGKWERVKPVREQFISSTEKELMNS